VTGLTQVRAHRRSISVVAAVALVLVVLSALSLGSAARGGDLDPDNPRGNGAQAVARVLAGHGVDVTVVRRAAALEDTAVDANTTVLVTSTGDLGRATARALGRHTTAAGALVLASPQPTVIRTLRLPLTVAGTGGGDSTEAGCADDLLEGLTVATGPSAGYGPRRDAPVTGCFEAPGAERGSTVSLVARVDRATTTYAVGATDLFTNAHVTDADNAAAALRLLGQHDRLVWYVPDLRDVPAGDAGSVSAQLPRGLVPALWLVAAAVVATMLWRGRRLGALVVEPLPVVVRAVESTQGRGRLYRRVRDRAHAAGILRAATTRRLTAHLRLPPGTSTGALVAPVAQATRRDRASVTDLLITRPVPDDSALTRLADDLAALEREVHRP
jgi:Domain of unknown function (DUF4350)